MKYLVAGMLSLGLVGCGSGDAPEVRINHVAYSGTGCPADSAKVILQNDRRTVSVLFDNATYQAEAGLGTGENGAGKKTGRAACDIAISLNIPSGYQAFLVGADFRGSVTLPIGAVAKFNREYFFAGETSPILTGVWEGDKFDEIITLSDDLYAESYSYSRCGEDVTLRSNTSVSIQVDDVNDDTASIQIDSFDYANKEQRAELRYEFVYEQCS